MHGQCAEQPVSNLPEEVRKQLKSCVSRMADEAFDLVVNLTGKLVDEGKRAKLKKKAELEISTEIEKAVTEVYRMGLRLREEQLQKKLEPASLKEKFYLVTDAVWRPLIPEIPKSVHAMDYLFQTCEALLRDFGFDFSYQKNTEYVAYLQGLERLMEQLKTEHKMSQSWNVLDQFLHSKDAYLILQATLQKVIKYYEFLERDFPRIEKNHIDKYLKIYEELSGIYEKFVALISVLIQLLAMNGNFDYEAVRKRSLHQNTFYIEKNGWEIFVSGFNRNVRNAIVHKTCKVDIIKETVEFIDRHKTLTLTFRNVQGATRELSALLLILPHTFVSVFCLAVLSLKEMLESLAK